MQPFSDGDDALDLFALPTFFKTPSWLDQLPYVQDDQGSFFSCKIKDLERITTSNFFPSKDLKMRDEGFFKTPYETPDVEETSAPSSPTTLSHEAPADTADLQDDVWLDLDEPLRQSPGLRTWQSASKGLAQADRPRLVSEAGPAVYDALLCHIDDPLALDNVEVPVVEARAYFSALLALALGRESVLFTREERSSTLVPRLKRMRVSGFSQDILQGLNRICHESSSMLSKLQIFVKRSYAKRTSPCSIALASALDQVLNAVQRHVVMVGHSPRSLLQLHSTVKSIVVILRPLVRLVSQLGTSYTDKALLDLIFEQTFAIEHEDEGLRMMMREVLSRVSQPWVEFVEEWLGTRTETGVPLTKFNVGESKGFVTVGTESYIDDAGQELQDVDFRLALERVPDFLPPDIAESVFETGCNLRFIRSCHPDHPLSHLAAMNSATPPRAEWLFDWQSILQLEDSVSRYRNDLQEAIQDAQQKTQEPAQMEDDQGHNEIFDFFKFDGQKMDAKFEAYKHHLDQPVLDPSTQDPIALIVSHRMASGTQAPTSTQDSTPHWSLLPVLCFGGITSAQAQAVNRESLRLLFEKHNLREHFSLQRDFHLLRNGNFCSRLSHALFDPELETAERQVGVARQGGVMGLRLSGRDTWPPASSELRLALMGVLKESYQVEQTTSERSATEDATVLPGDLSFSVRDLSHEELDRCMDPDSLEAVDFLRLSYKAPPELSSIISPPALTQYDRIFRLLLRVLRMLFVVDQMFREVTWRGGKTEHSDPASYRLVTEAHHLISTLAAYFLDTGVAIPWNDFENRLEVIRADLGHNVLNPDNVDASPSKLRGLHMQMLGRIMQSLFLRKRQQPVLKLLEDIFHIVLRFAKGLRLRSLGKTSLDGAENVRPAQMYAEYRTKVQIFITVCRGLSEKSRPGQKGGSGQGEDSVVAQLLLKLDMFDYHCKR